MKYYSRFLAELLIFISICSVSAYAGDVTPLRILKEHKVTVATNGATDRLSRAFMDWQFAPFKTTTLFQLLIDRENLKTDGDVLFIMDRSQPITREEAALLPVPLTAIDENEVLTAVVKKSIGNKHNYKNGWLILVVAPNQEWLDNELELIPEVLNTIVSEQPGLLTRLHFYDVFMLDIVSNIEKELSDKWTAAQLDPNKQAVDYTFTSLESWEGNTGRGRNMMFILDGQKLDVHRDRVCLAVPKGIREWVGNMSSASEGVAVNGAVEVCGKRINSYAIIAPCERLIYRMLDRYPSIDSIPSTAAKIPFSNLSDLGQMAVMVRFADKSVQDNGVLHDFSNKMLTALRASFTGFETKSYQDLRELQIDKLFESDGISRDDVNSISKKFNNARGLMVLSLASIGLKTQYAARDLVAMTKPYPEFSKSRPSEPTEPSLSDRKYGIAGPRLYTGPDDPKYIQRKAQYQEARLRWEYYMVLWQNEYNEYENRRAYHDIEWKARIDQIESVEISGNIAIYDTREDSDIAGTVVYSAAVNGFADKRTVYKEFQLIVTGEGRRPDAVDVPEAKVDIDDDTLLSTAFENASQSAVRHIMDSCILPTDKIIKQASAEQ